MKIINPQKLKKGNTIGLLSVSGALSTQQQNELNNAKNYFESKGFKTKISETSFHSNNYLCDTDTERIKAIENFFTDSSIDAIVTTRGGYGVLRIIDKIDYSIIKSNPKIFVGYSDISALLWKIFQKTHLVTFHGAMACSDFGNEITPFTEAAFFKTLSDGCFSCHIKKIHCDNTDVVNGTLCPMNLATLASLNNSDYDFDENIILMLEDINEPTYKIDRMITMLFRNHFFNKRTKAIILGDFGKLDNIDYFYSFWEEFYNNHKIPIFKNNKFGHITEKLTIPFGVNAEINLQNSELRLKN